MKKNRMAVWSLCLCLVSLCITGCTNVEEGSASIVESTTDVTTTMAETTSVTTITTKPEKTYKTIGIESEGEGIYAIHLINKTNAVITGFTMEDGVSESALENMLAEDEPFETDEERILYIDTTQASQDEKTPTYTVVITVEGDMVYKLHTFPYQNMDSCQLHIEDGVAFLTYTDLTTNEELSTKESEIAIQQEEEQQALVEEQQNQAVKEDYNAEVQSVETQPILTEAPATDPPVTEPPVTDPPATDPPAADPNDGCIGDGGLFY